MKTRAVVTSVGARTPIGLTAQPTAFLYRAAHVVMQQSPILDADGQQATLAALPTLDPRTVGSERVSELSCPALEEALAPLLALSAKPRTKLLLCLDDYLARNAPRAYEVTARLTRVLERLGGAIDVATSARGPASLGFSLDGVLGELESGSVDAVIVGGVHSDYDPERIQALSQAGRLFTTDRLDAIIPGECAAFAVLMTASTARRHGLTPLAQVHGCATGFSKARPDNDESAFDASGLTAATRKAAEPMQEAQLRCGWMLTDLSFETMRLYEFQAMSTRTQKLWCEPQYCDAPAQRLGYLGAAAMPLHLVLAAESWRAGFAPHPVAMSFAGSDAGERAVMLLSAP